MCRKSAHVIGLKKGWFFTSDAPALEPNRRISSLIRSFRITDLQRLILVRSCSHALCENLLGALSCARVIWKGHIVFQYVGEGSISVFALERRCPEKHLVYQNTKSPPINCTCVSISFDDLRGDVLFGTHERVCSKVSNA